MSESVIGLRSVISGYDLSEVARICVREAVRLQREWEILDEGRSAMVYLDKNTAMLFSPRGHRGYDYKEISFNGDEWVVDYEEDFSHTSGMRL